MSVVARTVKGRRSSDNLLWRGELDLDDPMTDLASVLSSLSDTLLAIRGDVTGR